MEHPAGASRPTDGERFPLGVIDMRLLAASDRTEGAFAIAEFSGKEGAWTVPHMHARSLEAFYVLDGRFTFTRGHDDFEVVPGQFVLIPKGTRHLMRAELSRLSPDALRDPEIRRQTAARYASIPV